MWVFLCPLPAVAIVVVLVVISSNCKVALIGASGSQKFLLFRSILSAQLFSAPFSLIPHRTRSSQTRSLKQRTGLSWHLFQEDKHSMRDEKRWHSFSPLAPRWRNSLLKHNVLQNLLKWSDMHPSLPSSPYPWSTIRRTSWCLIKLSHDKADEKKLHLMICAYFTLIPLTKYTSFVQQYREEHMNKRHTYLHTRRVLCVNICDYTSFEE